MNCRPFQRTTSASPISIPDVAGRKTMLFHFVTSFVLHLFLSGHPNKLIQPCFPIACQQAHKLMGLRATVRSISPLRKTMIEIVYRLEYVKSKELWVVEPTEVVHVLYWNQNGKKLDETFASRIFLGDAFSARKQRIVEVKIRIRPPREAATLAIELGSSDLVTRRAKIPRK
jgi:hypothetical protein